MYSVAVTLHFPHCTYSRWRYTACCELLRRRRRRSVPNEAENATGRSELTRSDQLPTTTKEAGDATVKRTRWPGRAAPRSRPEPDLCGQCRWECLPWSTSAQLTNRERRGNRRTAAKHRDRAAESEAHGQWWRHGKWAQISGGVARSHQSGSSKNT